MNRLKLDSSNYFSQEANQQYMSVSQYKDFLKCEARALAKIKGEYKQEESDALLTGKYVHAWNEGTLEQFKKENSALYKKDGGLYAKYQNLDDVIKTIQSDRLMMMALEGQKEVIMTAELFGVPWKIMIDSYNPDKGRFSDLKVVKGLHDKFWSNYHERYVNFIEHYGYTTQIAVYSEIEKLGTGRDSYLEGLIAAVTKENPPDKAVIGFDTEMIEFELMKIESNLPRILQIKNGEIEPNGCGECEYCKSVKQLSKVIHYSEL
ncbi:PD-(D/E)XK nuclease-like domain-containing protein [Brassicibacter mesophilus]|uniref:PD-(D/E)XK nuclease-like domain-containing protein n=1 Tax=Brassicibacter mesophilus TaxID=745119 RepID=UPI003D1E1808